ncbi:BTB domain-containingand ankyrin repeat protein [Purpureocillium lavendulum]|uniref:BTB domain-containingand ankyrin repeat protein n=1 Tax=Purpureocillium lavendulum TaxID=1247861 RepID=A0AB34FSG7_9HYPO|nr:BTB domain-containingand ankyrin repeat protein [Purpureocillium lavendulum]
MSHLLWTSYWQSNVDQFRRLLAPAGTGNSGGQPRSPAVGHGGGHSAASPGAYGTPPRGGKIRRPTTVSTPSHGRPRDGGAALGRNEINSRDHAGLTLLLRAASSTDPNAHEFVDALLEHPAIDIHVRDPESGWNALHRSLYAGNVSIARALLAKERGDLTNHALSVGKVGQLIKTKDNEGNSPFDLFNSTVATRSLKYRHDAHESEDGSASGDSDDEVTHASNSDSSGALGSTQGGELYVFGSNKNLSLGVGDGDDRQFPERILLQRPDELLHRFHQAYLEHHDMDSSQSLPDLEGIPTLIRNKPLIIQDVVMSKLHTAVVTTDPVLNLYVCGVGRSGRLGLGDENTQFKFVPVQGPFSDRKVRQVALGQNHSMAVVGNGELWTWGSNADSQLGYLLPPPARSDEEPVSLMPRQVFGPLKKEVVLGVAASAVHSVAFTNSALYCWGRNLGQLALMDADSRTLAVQQIPRKVAASLLSSPVQMVSAIDKATTCLLANHTVWVFTNYGYNLVKFPTPDVFTNHNLTVTSFSTRYDSGRRDIRYIASGCETIAAVTSRGDLYTMQLNPKVDANQPAGSTTNPVKIKGAVTQPQCIWDSRKDGVTSVSVGEHGSVIISTESGAVWKRVKRTKGKTATFSRVSDAKKKDFKFERVPYITGCVNVRSSTFGAFSAVRKDISVMSEEIRVDQKSLWKDFAALLSLRDFTATENTASTSGPRKVWQAAIAREKPGSVSREILGSPNIEEDLGKWLQASSFRYGDLDTEIRTTTSPDLRIPVHGWVLAGRSPVLRESLSQYRRRGTAAHSDAFVMERLNGKQVLTLPGVDIYTILNIVLFTYEDNIIPVWKYTREAPANAYRFRQVRTELMKVATGLHMPKLEMAARLQTIIEPSLDVDMKAAVADPDYFDDGDIIVQLDGADVVAHGQLLCQRCPFFEGMFYGRSQGQWLADRRGGSSVIEQIQIDLKHIRPEIFEYVLEHLYSDAGEEMFDNVAVPSIDDFSELVLDVMGAANELMLDRLSQICQSLIGKFVTTRNIANLLNEISACSVSEFKDVGLEYICLQLEGMLENHLLDGLDDDLVEELDEVVRGNQLARLPFSKSGRAEALLHDKYPDLAIDIDEERRRRVKEMAFKLAQREDERKISSSWKARIGSLDDSVLGTQTPDRNRPRSRAGRNEPFSPSLRPKESQGDMIFNMDEDDSTRLSSPASPVYVRAERSQDADVEGMPELPEGWQTARGLSAANSGKPTPSSLSPAQAPNAIAANVSDVPPLQLGAPFRKVSGPWAAPALPTAKLDLKDMLSQDTSKSALTTGLAAQAGKSTAPARTQPKMSQKERKKQLQLQAEAEAAAQDDKTKQVPWEKVAADGRPAPWKAASPIPKTSLKEAMSAETTRTAPARTKPLVASEAEPSRRRTVSPDTRFPGQGRTNNSPAATPVSSGQQQKPLVPHSKSYITPTPRAEPEPGTSMADIIGQQRREQELVKEAVAKRSLQEIQQEQAFQEWWDQESRRAQEEEQRRQAKGSEKSAAGSRRGRKGKVSKGKGPESTAGGEQPAGRGRGGTNVKGKGNRG